MELLYFIVVAVAIYLLADRILRLIEQYLGRTLEQRSAVFFFIILALALASFSAIRHFVN